MALVTDPAFVIQQLRLASLNSDGAIAERVIHFPNPDGGGDAEEPPSYNEHHFAYNPNVIEGNGFLPSNPKKAQEAARQHRTTVQVGRHAAVGNEVVQAARDAQDAEDEDESEAPAQQTSKSLQAGATSGPTFAKVKVAKSAGGSVSALSTLIAQKSGIENPFSKYSSFCGKGEARPIRLKIWLPFSEGPKTPLKLIVKRDATVQDVIGYALYEYSDMGRKPDALSNMEAYSLRIVEDDGVIDDDFPALERGRQIEKFSFDQFALCETQRAKYEAQEKAKKAAKEKLEPKKRQKLLLKIHLYSTLEIKQSSTISVYSDETLRDVLKKLCVKHELSFDDYTLRLTDTKTDLDLSQTVEESNVSAVCVMKKVRQSAGDIYIRPAGERNVDADKESSRYSAVLTQFAGFKKYNVKRRNAVFGSKQDRVLAIDGDIIHIMPAETKSTFGSNKTTTIHISAVISFEPIAQNVIRFVIKKEKEKDKGDKVYDFETDPHETDEIIHRLYLQKEKSQ